MESFARPLRALQDALAYFVRARELRVLHVLTDGDLRVAALTLASAAELLPDNSDAFVTLEDAFTAADEGWTSRAARLRERHALRRQKMAEEGRALPELPPPPTGLLPAAAFAAQLRQIAETRADWISGVVVVLAPTRVDDARAWADAVRALVESPALRDVRWILVEVESNSLAPLLERMGESALRVTCRIDDEASRKDLAQMLDAAASSAGASGPARIGAAWPRGVRPPPRPGRPDLSPEQAQVQLEAMGVSLPPMAGALGSELTRRVLLAAQAMRDQRGAEGVRLQREARDLCLRAALVREAVLMEIVLGAYLVQLGQRPAALEAYGAAARRAREHQFADLAAQAHMGAGAVLLVERERERAAAEYAKAGAAAREGGATLLAIEGFRMAGQVLLEAGREQQAAQAFREALALAEAAPPPEARASSAPEAARALAAVCRRRGLETQACALEAQAEGIAAGGTEPGALMEA